MNHDQDHTELMVLHALGVLPPSEAPLAQARLSACAECRRESESLGSLVGSFVAWPTDVLRPATPLWDRLAERIAHETGQPPLPAAPSSEAKPEWQEVAPGISCKLLATDPERHRVSMLVRLTPGTDYPPHRHAGVEELHLLHGELVVDDRTLQPGDYIRAVVDSVDHRIFSATGCTCVLVTSFHDAIL